MQRAPDWRDGERGWKVGFSDAATARHIVDRDFVQHARRLLIHAGGKFRCWTGDGWAEADRDMLEAKAWELLAGRRTAARVRAVLFALKMDTQWTPTPAGAP